MNFIKTKDNEYIAVETIAKITDVTVECKPFGDTGINANVYSFKIETKRGNTSTVINICSGAFSELIGGV